MQKCGFSSFENAWTSQLVKLETKCSNEPHVRLPFDMLAFSYNRPPSWNASELIDFKFESEPACIIKAGHEQHLVQFKSKPQKYVTGKSFDSDFVF